jgi:hypothetical protein
MVLVCLVLAQTNVPKDEGEVEADLTPEQIVQRDYIKMEKELVEYDKVWGPMHYRPY